jgi:molybdopterin synthase catalytic subunit
MTKNFSSSAPLPCETTQPFIATRASEKLRAARSDRNIASGFEVRVQRQRINFDAEVAPLTRNPRVGAVVNFLGVVRQSAGQDDVAALKIEHYPGMTEQTLWTIVEEAIARWDLQAVRIIHRVGRLPLGEAVVLIVVAAEHRAAAFNACEFLMDFLKIHAPFWKKEIGIDGSSRWLEAKTQDERAMERWG